MKDRLLRYLGEKGEWMGFACDCTSSLQEAVKLRHYSSGSLQGIGGLMLLSAMLGSTLKGEGCDLSAELKSFNGKEDLIANADSFIHVKAYSASISSPVLSGPGLFIVTKDLGLKEPYQSSVLCDMGNLEKAMEEYFVQSEQIETYCKLGVLFHPDGTLHRAFGYMVQALPFADDSTRKAIHDAWNKMPSLEALDFHQNSLEEILGMLLGEKGYDTKIEKEIEWKCLCSQEKSRKTLSLLPLNELSQIAEEGKTIHVDCGFCGKSYYFTSDDLRAILSEKEKKASKA